MIIRMGRSATAVYGVSGFHFSNDRTATILSKSEGRFVFFVAHFWS
jgi:hypothetical protein